MDKELEKAFSELQRNLGILHRLRPTEYVAPEGITPAELKIIMQISIQLKHHHEVRPSMIASCNHITKGALSQSLKSLETKGIITRSKSLEDSRAVTLHFTEEGQRIANEAEKLHLDYMKRLIEYLGVDEVNSINNTMRKVLAFHTEEEAKRKQHNHSTFEKDPKSHK